MRAAVVALLALIAGCAELPAVPAGTCGNHVVELDEECDGTEGCGAADGANACFLVCDDAGAGCPAEGGYRCGADGRCRVPTETFTVTAVQSSGAYGVSAVDMDGDGAADLLGHDSRGLLIRWGDWDGVLGGSTRLAMPLTTQEATTLDVDGNGHRDVALPIANLGYGLFLGDGARGMSAAAQSAISLDFGQDCLPVTVGSIRVDGSQTGEPQLLMALGGVFMGFIQDEDGCDPDPDFDCLLSPTPGELVDGRFISAPLGYGALSGVEPAEQFTAAVVGQQTVSVWGEDIDPTRLRPQRVASWALDEPIAEDGHLAFADLDGDGCDDLVVDTGSGGSLQVAYSQMFVGVCAGLQASRVRHERPPGTVLGIGDVSGDGRAEIVFSAGFEDGGISGNAIFTYVPATGALTGPVAALQEEPATAVVLDYNRDGWNDLVVTYRGVQTVDFYLNYQGGGFSRFPIEVGGFPRRPVVGDFDGDLLEDIVVAVVDPTDPQGNDRAVIVYGEAGGRPLGAQFLGDFLAQVRPVKVEGGVQPNTDSVMLVSNRISENPEECDHRLSVLIGDTSRQPVSPYIHLFDSGSGAPEPTFPISVVDLSSATEPRVLALGLVASVTGTDLGLSLLGFDGTNYVPGGSDLVLPGSALAVFDILYTSWRTGDLDGDDQPEGLALVGDRAVILRIEGGQIETEVQDVATALTGAQWGDLVDMDGDGDLDIIGSGTGGVVPQDASTPVAPASTFWMIENDGGSLDFADPVVLTMPDELYCAAAEVIVSDATAVPQVIAACYQGAGAVIAIGVFDPAADPDQVSGVRTLPIDGDIFTLEVADLTGDGLDDIAVVGPTTTTVLRQCRTEEVGSGSCAALDPLP